MNIFQRIKNWFTGGSSNKRKRRRDEPTSSREDGSSRGGGSYSEGAVSERRRQIDIAKAQKRQQDKTTKSLASIGTNIDKKLSAKPTQQQKPQKATPPKVKATAKPKTNYDPKQELVREAHDRHKKKFEEVKKKYDAERASYHKATGNKYNTNVGTKEQRAEARRRIKSGEYQSDPEAAKWEYIHHPKRSSFMRGAVSGATFGGSEILAKVAPMSKSAREAEKTYQKHKSRGWEVAGEVAGSIPSFMMTGGASASLVGGAAKKVAPKLFEKGSEAAVRKVASSAIVRKGAEKAAERAVEQGLVKNATKEVVERIARERAERLVAGAGKDFAINATTGALMDASYAARDSKNLGEFGKNFATNQALSYGLGGALTIAPELRVGRGVLGMKGGLRDEIANDLIRDTAARDKLRRATMSAGELRNVEPPRVSVPRLGNVDNAVEDAARSAVDNAVTPARDAISEAGERIDINNLTQPSADYGYHAGDLGKAEWFRNQATGGRDTGHFGTGTYFVGNKEILSREGYGNRPQHKVDFKKYRLYKPKDADTGFNVHRRLRQLNEFSLDPDGLLKELNLTGEDVERASDIVTGLLRQGDVDAANEVAGRVLTKGELNAVAYDAERRLNLWIENGVENATPERAYQVALDDAVYNKAQGLIANGNEQYAGFVDDLARDLGVSTEDVQNALANTVNTLKAYPEGAGDLINQQNFDSASTIFMKNLGFEGVDVRGIDRLDNTGYGSVIYDLHPEDLTETARAKNATQSVTAAEREEQEPLADLLERYRERAESAPEPTYKDIEDDLTDEQLDEEISKFLDENPEYLGMFGDKTPKAKPKAEVETKQPSLLDTEINPAKSAEPATETATEAVSKNATEADTATIRKEREKLMRERRKLKKSLDAENPDANTVKRIEKLDKQIKEKGDQLGIGMPKTKEKPKPQPKATQNVDDFAGVSDDIPMNSAKAQTKLTDEVDKAVNKTAKDYHATSNKFLDEMAEARKAEGVDFPENKNFKQASVSQAEQVSGEYVRTKTKHTKKGYITIATGIGDESFQGAAYKVVHEGGVTIDVWHDKTRYADGARRVMKAADEDGGIQVLADRFSRYAAGTEKLNSKEQRELLFDALAAVDFANANKHEPWAEKLFLSAIDAAGEQASVSGLTLRQFHKISMSSPSHRADVVKQQIERMFNKSKGFVKMYGEIGEGNLNGFKDLDTFIKANPEFKEAMESLAKLGEAASLEDVEKAAEKCLLEARKVIPATVLDTVTQWRYVAMLSSPKTHVRNFVGNAYSATIGQFKTALASTIEDSVFKNNKELLKQVQAGKINKDEMFKSATGLSWAANKDSRIGILTGIKLDGAKSRLAKAEEALSKIKATDETALKAAKKRVDDISSEVSRLEKQLAEKKPKRLSAAKAQESWHSTSKEKLITNVQKFEQKFSHNAKGRVSKGVNKMSDVVGLALETSDAASVERIYREAYDKCLMANGWERLAEQAKGAGKEAKAAQARMKRIEEFAEEIASYKAAQDTYRNYNAVSNWMNKVVNDTLFNYNAPIYKKAGGFLLHAVMPFTKVPTNIVKRGFEYSPAGLIEGKKMLSEAIKHGDVVAINKACERLAEGCVGTGILALGAGLGALDPDGFNITTRLSSNDFVDKQKRDRGYQDYSATINNVNFTLDWATPTSATLFTGVEFGQMFRKVADTISGESGLELNVSELVNFPMEMVSSLVEPTLQLTMFQGINKTLEDVIKSDNYSSTNVNPAIKIVSEIFSNYVTSMIPAALGGISRAFAPYDYFVTGDSDLTYMLNSTAAKIPFLSNQMFGAKTNVWGQIKNERVTTGDKVGSVAKNLFSPANINKVTWDETDDWALNYYKDTGWEGIFPKNNYDKEVHVGRIKGEHDIKMSNKELAEYNVQRGKSGSDAMNDALDTVIFHRWYKDSKGKYTIEGEDNITEAERDKLVKQFKGKGIKDVVDWVRETPQFKNATPKEQQQVISIIYGETGMFGGDDDESKGAKRYAERYIAGKKGMKAAEYDFYNETPRTIQENLQPAIDSGLITYEEAVDFTRNAGKTYYRTDQRGEKGGTVTTHYNKKEMLAYLESKGYSEEKAATLFNAYKQSNAKEYGASSYRRGYRRRGGYHRWHRHGHGGGSGRVGVNKTAPKVRGLKGGVALTAKSASKSAADIAKKQPKLERVKSKVTLPDAKW